MVRKILWISKKTFFDTTNKLDKIKANQQKDALIDESSQIVFYTLEPLDNV